MAGATDLMGLGLPPFLAARMAATVVSITAQGVAAGSATQMAQFPGIFLVNGSNSGSGIKLPPVGGDTGCLLGDTFTVCNYLSATIAIYAANNAAGSAVTIIARGTSVAGTTGVSISTGITGDFWPVSPSTWFLATSA